MACKDRKREGMGSFLSNEKAQPLFTYALTATGLPQGHSPWSFFLTLQQIQACSKKQKTPPISSRNSCPSIIIFHQHSLLVVVFGFYICPQERTAPGICCFSLFHGHSRVPFLSPLKAYFNWTCINVLALITTIHKQQYKKSTHVGTQGPQTWGRSSYCGESENT